jgi:hypothetical protein
MSDKPLISWPKDQRAELARKGPEYLLFAFGYDGAAGKHLCKCIMKKALAVKLTNFAMMLYLGKSPRKAFEKAFPDELASTSNPDHSASVARNPRQK